MLYHNPCFIDVAQPASISYFALGIANQYFTVRNQSEMGSARCMRFELQRAVPAGNTETFPSVSTMRDVPYAKVIPMVFFPFRISRMKHPRSAIKRV
jgi:hypothetical protein